MKARRLGVALVALGFARCGGSAVDAELVDDPQGTGVLELSIAEGSPEASAVVALVNAPSTSLELLDDEVGLDRRAAQGLISRRPFSTLAQIDAVPYVGQVAFNKLYAFAAEHGFVPSDESGTFETIYFTVEQARATLALANQASLAQLDDDAHLDKRAAAAIVAARPIGTMNALAAVSYVGAVALRLLRDYSDRQTPAFATCSQDLPCAAPLVCLGRPALGQAIGRCVDPSSSAWLSREVVDEGSGSIPDNAPGGTGAGLLVYGVGPILSRATIHAEINHPRPSDLRYELEAPDGSVIAIPRNPRATGPSLSVELVVDQAPLTTPANGDWVLRFIDDVAGQSGDYRGWRMQVETRWPTGAETAARLQPILALPNLYHTSESDYPYQLVRVPGRGTQPITAQNLKSILAGVYVARPEEADLATREIETADVTAFFDRYTEPQDWWDEGYFPLVEPNRRLRTLLQEELTELQLFRLGTRYNPSSPLSGAIDVFILGRTRDGDVVGVWTVSVET